MACCLPGQLMSVCKPLFFAVCATMNQQVSRGSIVASAGQQTSNEEETVGLIERLLLRRAASNVNRGYCSCLKCKGSGTCECPMCKGEGIVEPGHGSHTQMNNIRDLASKIESFFGGNTQASGQKWLRTNRCTRCHGSGQLTCQNCSGSGLRYKAHAGDECIIPER